MGARLLCNKSSQLQVSFDGACSYFFVYTPAIVEVTDAISIR